MHITFVTIFPEIYTSFLATSLIKKAQEKNLLQFECINPREFCDDNHQQIDDEIYGGGAGMLMKAKPIVDAIQKILHENNLHPQTPEQVSRKIFFLSPTKNIFNQRLAYEYATLDYIIFVSGRYEGIDYRFQEYMRKTYPHNFTSLSLGQFVTLGGETPSMIMTESIVRLIPGVIKEEASHLLESYDPLQDMKNIEYPQYTRPEEVFFDDQSYKVPEILLHGHHANIAKRRDENIEQC